MVCEETHAVTLTRHKGLTPCGHCFGRPPGDFYACFPGLHWVLTYILEASNAHTVLTVSCNIAG